MIRIGKITLSAKGITDEITDNHPIDICSVETKVTSVISWHFSDKNKKTVGTFYCLV